MVFCMKQEGRDGKASRPGKGDVLVVQVYLFRNSQILRPALQLPKLAPHGSKVSFLIKGIFIVGAGKVSVIDMLHDVVFLAEKRPHPAYL